ncbi:MAG: DUF4178 domain-containing protein [Clostridia bacterium]|nr:DUF4178 domain-containing protein [Clostridia bacterium]
MRLKKGQILYIDNQKYTVINMIEFAEDTWVWQEYEIVSETGLHRWLSIETNENNQDEFYIYDIFRGIVKTSEIEFTLGNKKYELYEKGKAVVKDYFGNADVDKYESCEFYDYISEDKKTIISVEKWYGETEKSIGELIENYRIKITDEIDRTKASTITTNTSKGTWKVIAIAILVVIFPFLAVFSGSSSKSIQKYISKQSSKYTYVTSVTNNTNNKKAKVYKSSLKTIDATVKDIIDGVPEGITKTTDIDSSTDDDGIGLQTKKEYAYIYEEDGKIYIQVSNKKYVDSSGGSTYHSSRYIYYRSSYTSSSQSSTYNDYAYSARQKSINSRTSSGGGTSSGK